ncbi:MULTISPECIES: auxiliary protein of the heavy metal cation-transporting efflux system HmyCBA [Cupriavidus]|uniref:Auxiliary protein of the heavy metal cation-transporting efflux system HmyCBA n=1 Tax=Cupriavidus pauculus TaxID=82633 RepID=A0A5P2H9L7_9BURK|nr:auxiliary protein of the heavy metal cation-transporting efflux system HmyCBA [Cupriavidus pauculus]QET04676.1 auxiliary protein of the heavy metal cation-transporting efflux system HmyCBA [Cupriavidus pauculus]
MRFVVYLLTALCLSALSFSAAANVRADAPAADAVMEAVAQSDAVVATGFFDDGDAAEQIVLPGDDPLEVEEIFVDNGPPPGYCNIWSADLLDPLDMLDEIEESSALFVLPPVPPVQFSVATYVAPSGGRAPSRPASLLRPPDALV